MNTLLCGNVQRIGDEFGLSGIVENSDDDDGDPQSLVVDGDESSAERENIDKGLSENEMKEVRAMPSKTTVSEKLLYPHTCNLFYLS